MDATSTQIYLEILEKTNQQLSLWYNPYGLMIAILTLLIAVLAIFFSYILWKQGKEYKDAFSVFLDEQKKVLSVETKLHVKSVLDEEIKELSDKLSEKQETLTVEARQKIEGEIQTFKNAQRNIGIFQPTISVTPNPQEVSNPTRPLFTDGQIRAVEALLGSFGADSETIHSATSVMKGRQPYAPEGGFIRSHLTSNQVEAIKNLIRAFGGDERVVVNIEDVLKGPYRA